MLLCRRNLLTIVLGPSPGSSAITSTLLITPKIKDRIDQLESPASLSSSNRIDLDHAGQQSLYRRRRFYASSCRPMERWTCYCELGRVPTKACSCNGSGYLPISWERGEAAPNGVRVVR